MMRWRDVASGGITGMFVLSSDMQWHSGLCKLQMLPDGSTITGSELQWVLSHQSPDLPLVQSSVSQLAGRDPELF